MIHLSAAYLYLSCVSSISDMAVSVLGQILIVFLAYYGMNSFINVYFVFGPFYERLGASSSSIGLFLSIFYMAMVVCRPLGSWALECFGIRRTLIGSSMLSALSAIGMALSLSSPTLLLFFRALSGVSVSIFIVTTIAYQSMILSANSRGVGFALFTTGSMLPMGTVVPLSEWLLEMGYSTLYLLLPILISLVCLALGFVVRDISNISKKEKVWGTYAELFSVSGVRTLYMTVFLMSLVDGGTLCVALLSAERNVSVSWFMMSASIAAICIRTIGFKIMNRVPRSLIAAPSAALMAAALLGLSFSSTPALFTIFGILFGLGIGISYPTNLAIIGDLLPKEFHPKAMGGFLLAMDFGWVITPLLFGYVSPFFGASGALRLISIFVILFVLLVHLFLWIPLRRSLQEKHAGC